MELINLRKYSAAFYLAVFLVSASLASANGLGLTSDPNAQIMNPVNESSIKTCLGTGSECFSGYMMSARNVITEGNDGQTGSMSEFFKDTTAITLHKGGNNSMWSLAPSVSKFSLNPMEDVKRVQVMLQYSFRF